MNDDVITGGSRIPRTPIQPSVPQINVPLPNVPTVARSLNFDTLPVEPQIIPSTDCTHPEPISEPNSKAASPVVVPQPTRDYSQLSKLRSNVAYEAVAGLDTISNRKPRGSFTSGTASGKRSPSFFC
ncbi:hypothetical protein GHT06_008861 [Daphnia sinensis]|uniref:Uncharacterized protein n=1 Tax=Daphnia sinensis TaxID=1820382 RepID=A0AAD5Q351_9CRUS|nr:hypothetical protein GHT06_008861 [Daphnia sinensis]